MKDRNKAYEQIAAMSDGANNPPEIEEINRSYALTVWGGKAVVIVDRPHESIRMISVEAFTEWFNNRTMNVLHAAGKVRSIPLGRAWRTHPHRRQYSGVEFFPNPDRAEGKPDYFNFWRGFSITPSARGSYDTFKDHMLHNVCGSDPRLFNYVFGWFSHMIQKPRERIGTALVLRGKMGSGKSKLGEVFGSLISPHYIQIDSDRYVTGQFNSHMGQCILLQADEAVWAGDKSAEGRLKGLSPLTFR